MDMDYYDAYEACLKEVDEELYEEYKIIAEKISALSNTYSIEKDVILNEMVVPSIEGELC